MAEPRASADVLAAFGIRARVPVGWDAHLYRRPDDTGAAAPSGAAASGTSPVLHLGNFALPPQRGDYGSGAVEAMGRGHVLVCLLEFDREAAATALFEREGVPRLEPADFHPQALQRVIAGQAGAQVFFHVGERAFCCYAVLGSHRLRATLVPLVNEALAGVTLEPA